MSEAAVDYADGRPVTLGVQHCQAPAAAADLVVRLRESLRSVTSSITVDLGPVLGCHVGPGAVGVVIGTQLDPITRGPSVS